ncbi:STAS domain-containing protein [Peribacillus kribbensis]|uniref:STAS domain-containing protein n=1 Tax=Peribacillus kribbensis TaxID=356658 RepID=UPI0003FA98A3|nr:STAS domain-containing protein [Peribacillus kribbensis]
MPLYQKKQYSNCEIPLRGDDSILKTSIDIIGKISYKVRSLKEQLARQRFNEDITIYSDVNEEKLRSWREELIRIFADSISESIEETYTHLTEWGNKSVHLLVDLTLPLDLAIDEVRFYRNTIGEIIKNESIKNKLSLEEFYVIISRFDSVVDRAVHWLSLSYTKTYIARIQAAEITALELSIPMVRITEEIGVLPIVGDLDTNRAQDLMEKALNYGTDLGLNCVIIDLSGVPIIDTMVANHLFKVVDALKLIGVKVALTGIRPEIAQTMVNLGIKLDGVISFSSLHIAIKTIQAV